MHKMFAMAAMAALMLVGCTAHTQTAVRTVEVPTLPPVSNELLAVYERPGRPAGGSPQQLLEHATAYGAWAQKIDAQVKGWQQWYRKGGQ